MELLHFEEKELPIDLEPRTILFLHSEESLSNLRLEVLFGHHRVITLSPVDDETLVVPIKRKQVFNVITKHGSVQANVFDNYPAYKVAIIEDDFRKLLPVLVFRFDKGNSNHLIPSFVSYDSKEIESLSELEKTLERIFIPILYFRVVVLIYEKTSSSLESYRNLSETFEREEVFLPGEDSAIVKLFDRCFYHKFTPEDHERIRSTSWRKTKVEEETDALVAPPNLKELSPQEKIDLLLVENQKLRRKLYNTTIKARNLKAKKKKVQL